MYESIKPQWTCSGLLGLHNHNQSNRPGDGEPEYLVPKHIYMRYIDSANSSPCSIDPSLMEKTSTTVGSTTVGSAKASARVGSATVQSAKASATVQSATRGLETVGLATARPRPRPLVGGQQMMDPIARAREKALAALGMPTIAVGPATVGLATVGLATVGSPKVGLATVGSETGESAMVQNTFQQITPPSSQLPPSSAPIVSASPHIRRSANVLAQQEAISKQIVGRRRSQRVKFAQ
jgi:hypothetical protein